MFKWCVVRCGHVSNEDWTMCSDFVDYPRFNSQCNLGDLYDRLRGERTSSLKVNKMYICQHRKI